jgi:hypothetical protein
MRETEMDRYHFTDHQSRSIGREVKHCNWTFACECLELADQFALVRYASDLSEFAS